MNQRLGLDYFSLELKPHVHLRCCPEMIEKTSVRHSVALGDLFINNDEAGPYYIFRS